MASLLLSFCAYGQPILRARRYPWLDSAVSLVSGNDLVAIFRWNMIGYPALRSMQQLISTFVYNKDHIRFNMLIACTILILGVGGTANYVGTRFKPNARIFGIDGLLAACLGYNTAVGKSLLFSFFNFRVDNTTYFWLEVGRLFFSGQHDLLVTVVAGGMMGHVLGVFHRKWLVESLAEQWRSSFRQLWR